ncbi:MAG: DUF1566 domain-containing protein [Bacteroidales bacterium]
MKKIFTILVAVLLTATVWSQAPQKMSYQAVIRNSSGVLVTNTQIGMQINIHQGTATGSVVYTETQTPITNANGMVSIEIGGGTGFSTINWANNSYFIETKTAIVAPLTTYTITGVSQFLSVPYALNAKKADSVNGIDGSETKITAGTNVTVTGSGTTASPYIVNASGGSGASHYVGELYGGGVVFYVDQTGSHGLICSMISISLGINWTKTSYQSTTVPAPGAISDWDGQANTTAIVTQAGAGSTYAAGLCDAYTNVNYGTGVYSDWYLPTIDQLNKLYISKYEVNKALDSDGNAATTALAKNIYWSSSEYSNNNAWYFSFDDGGTYDNGKSILFLVRAVRAF